MKFPRKIVLSIMTLVMLAATLTTTTFAWFNTYSNVVVEGFNITATGGQGFLISIDNVNYYNDLTKDKLLSAIILATDKAENPNSPLYKLENEVLYLTSDNTEVTLGDKIDIIKENFKLKPRTTQDGMNFEDLYGSNVTLSDKSYISFDIYFKQASTNPDENLKYDIYLYGDETKTLDNGTVIPQTKFSSNPIIVNLRSSLTTYDLINKQAINYVKGEDLKTYAANAMRMSVLEETRTSAEIYELTNSEDLGSYATTYEAINDTTSTEEEKQLKTKLYDCRYNAGYTYYNNLRNGLLNGKELDYDTKLPATIRDITSSNENLPTITHVESGQTGKKVTFTIWLEGWDADCFDGIANNVYIDLSFTSKKVN